MTFPLIERVRRLAEKATRGPWQAKRHNDYTGKVSVESEQHYIADCVDQVSRDQDEMNAAFIAAMRTDAPALADVAEQALKALARIHEFAISAIEGGAYASDMLPLIDKEARRVLALAEKE